MSIAAILRHPPAKAIALVDPFDARLEGELYAAQVCVPPVTDEDIAAHVARYRFVHYRPSAAELARCRAWITARRLQTDGRSLLVSGGTLCTEARTAFMLDGVAYPSLRIFYEALKIPPDARAAFVADPLGSGFHTRRRHAMSFNYGGTTIAVGSVEHLQLIARATSAKVATHADVRHALRATGRARLFMGHMRSQPLGRAVPFSYMVERLRLG